MLKYLKHFFIGLFLGIGLIGYTYFGPPKYTHSLKRSYVFQTYISPTIEKMLSGTGEPQETVAFLKAGNGDLSFRPRSELVFRPAGEGQTLFGGTLVSAGPNSRATITLIDDSTLTLESNSTILLEEPERNATEKSITLKVIQGTIAAQKEQSSKLNVKIVSAKGVVKSVSKDQKTVVIAQKKKTVSGDNSKLRVEEEEVDEIVGTVKEDTNLKELEEKLFDSAPLISARVRAASQRISEKTPETEISLDDIAKLTSALEEESKKSQSTDESGQLVAKKPEQTISPSAFDSLPSDFLEELNQVPSEPNPPSQTQTSSSGTDGRAPASLTFREVNSELSFGKVDVEEENRKIEEAKKMAEAEAKAAELAKAKQEEEERLAAKIKAEKEAELAKKEAAKKKAEEKKKSLLAIEKERQRQAQLVASQKPVRLELIRHDQFVAKEALKKAAPLAVDQSFSTAIKAQAKGQTDVANRVYASTMTRPEYASTGFGEATQLALNNMMTNYLQAGECANARDTIQNVEKSYPSSTTAKTWIEKWKQKLAQKCSK
jgi:hypothetical protein